MDKILEKLRQKENLTFEESKSAFELLMTGKASEDEIYNFLTLLSEKGEVSDEIAGGVYVLREKSKRVKKSIFGFTLLVCVASIEENSY